MTEDGYELQDSENKPGINKLQSNDFIRARTEHTLLVPNKEHTIMNSDKLQDIVQTGIGTMEIEDNLIL